MFDASAITRLRGTYRSPAALCVLFLLLISAQTNARSSDPKLLKALFEHAAFSADQIAALERGEPVTKLIPSSDPREVAVCGAIEIPSDPETALKAFQLSLSLKLNSALQSGKFTNPPRIEDLASLTLSDTDIADLKTCTVGDCKLKLSAAMIHRFQKGLDWNATDYKEQANQLFRLMIVEYVTGYLQRGDAALIEYADQNQRVPLVREQELLLKNLLYFKDTAPEFVRHLKGLPRSSVPVERSLTWAKINFGLKPVLVITDMSTYRSEVDGVPRVLVLSKQIYANHYFDASLSLTAAIADQTGTKSYLLYVNQSRAGALAGSFSKIKHHVVESRATEDLKHLLGETRLNLDAVLSNSSPPFQPTLTQRFSESPMLRTIFWFALLIVIARIGRYYTFGWKTLRSHRPASLRQQDPIFPLTEVHVGNDGEGDNAVLQRMAYSTRAPELVQCVAAKQQTEPGRAYRQESR